MELSEIEFPVYGITNTYRKIWSDLNVLYIETNYGIFILDNKNIPGNTLGKRRIKLNAENKYKFRKTYYNIEQFLHSKYTKFIDNTGKLFSWKKSKYVPLTYHKIKKVVEYDGQCIIYPEGINFTQKVNCRRAYFTNYIGVLHTDMGYILYEYTDKKKLDTIRKI